MKKLNLLAKTFIYTFSLVAILLLFAHTLLYLSLPTFYLAQKNKEATQRLTELVSSLKTKNLEEILQISEKYAVTYNTNIDLFTAQKTYQFHGYTPIDIQFSEDVLENPETKIIDQKNLAGNSLILAQDQFTNPAGIKFKIQLMLNVQPIDEAKQVAFKLLPYTFFLGLIVALIAAYLYSKMLTTPIRKILEVTKKMEQLTPDAHNQVTSEDELGLLAENINDLYDTLWHTIDSLENQLALNKTLEGEKLEFLRGASHELKTPLTSLSILLENMQLNIGKYQNRDYYLLEAQKLTENLTQMIHDILENTQLQKIPQNQQLHSVKETLLTMVQTYEIIARSKRIDFEVHLVEDITLLIDVQQLEKLFSNLLANALAYTPEGKKIKITLENGLFTIKNETPEISSSDLDQLCLPFYRPDFSRDKKDGGTGLGLYFVKNILNSQQIPFHLTWQAGYFIFEIDFQKAHKNI